MQPSMPMPASLQRWQGRWRSQPFLLLRHRWQRGFEDRSSSSAPSWCWKLRLEPDDLRAWPLEAGADGAFIRPGWTTGLLTFGTLAGRTLDGLPFFKTEVDLGRYPFVGPSCIFVLIFFVFGCP